MSSGGPARQSDSLADVVEMLLDKGVVVNADIVVSIGDTELLGVQLRAAIASFETAAEYGLEFPEGTDMRRVEEASGRSELPDEDEDTVQTAIVEASEAVGESDEGGSEPGIRARPTGSGGDESEGGEESDDEGEPEDDDDD
jgi:hypothetical protein